jgi:hypothetical protein
MPITYAPNERGAAVAVYQRYVDDIIAGVSKALVTVDPAPFFAKYGNNSWAAVQQYQAAQVAYAARTTFVILESIRLDLGTDSQVHP